MDTLAPSEIAQIRLVPHFRDSGEASLDLAAHYASYVAAYVDLAEAYGLSTARRTFVDVGAGYGWLAIALARSCDATIIAIEKDAARLQAARSIAAILGVEDRIEWRVGALPDLPLNAQEADFTFCIEVIEHAGRQSAIVSELARVTRSLLVITTPNLLFPIIGHDTVLPFCHWLPNSARNVYARCFGRLRLQAGNQFWSIGQVERSLAGFRRVSVFQHYPSVAEWLRRRPALPCGILHRMFLDIASHLGPNAVHCLPNIASTFARLEG